MHRVIQTARVVAFAERGSDGLRGDERKWHEVLLEHGCILRVSVCLMSTLEEDAVTGRDAGLLICNHNRANCAMNHGHAFCIWCRIWTGLFIIPALTLTSSWLSGQQTSYFVNKSETDWSWLNGGLNVKLNRCRISFCFHEDSCTSGRGLQQHTTHTHCRSELLWGYTGGQSTNTYIMLHCKQFQNHIWSNASIELVLFGVTDKKLGSIVSLCPLFLWLSTCVCFRASRIINTKIMDGIF